jgi:hypothetical protein
VEAVAEPAEGFKTGRVDCDITVGLLVFAVFVFVSFICSGAVDSDRANPKAVWVAAGDVDEEVGDVFASKGDDVKSEVRFAWLRQPFNSLFNVGEESRLLADG